MRVENRALAQTLFIKNTKYPVKYRLLFNLYGYLPVFILFNVKYEWFS